MVSPQTIRKHIRTALEPYKTDRYIVEVNSGGYPIKIPIYDIPMDKVEEIGTKCGYGASIGTNPEGYKRIYFDTNRDMGVQLSFPILIKRVSTGFTGKAEQIDEHHTYKTTMDVGDDTIELITKQTEKAVRVRMVTPKGNRYERWLPKSTLIPIKREVKTNSVVSQYTQLSEYWQVKVLGGSLSRNKTYGNKESYNRRILNLTKQGGRVFCTRDVNNTHTAYVLDPEEHLESRIDNVIHGWEYQYKHTKDSLVQNQYFELIQVLYQYKGTIKSKKSA